MTKKKIKEISLYSPNGWDMLEKLREGTQLQLKKRGVTVSLCFTYKNKEYEIMNFAEAPRGEGVMDWGEYKQRTKTM